MKASKHLDLIYKVAKYLREIKCHCGYSGDPLGDGRCPKCGAIGGKKSSVNINNRSIYDMPVDKSQSTADLYSDIQAGIDEFYDAY